MPHIAINARGVRPVRLDGYEGKAVMADEPLGDGGAGTIEFRVPWVASPMSTTRASAKRSKNKANASARSGAGSGSQ